MDHFEELKKYKELLDDGIITQEEFGQIKKKLLPKSNNDSVQEKSLIIHEPCSEDIVNTTDNNLSSASEVVECINQFEPTENVSEKKANSKIKSKKNKIALIGAVCCLVAIAVAAGIFFMSDIGKIQGSWKVSTLMLKGQETSPLGSVGGNLKISGNKWTMELHSTKTDTFTGTLKSSEKTTTNDGKEAVFYDFYRDGGSTLRAAYLPESHAIMVCTSSVFDSDNGIIFEKE